jgi:hypothetical protein
MTVIAARCEHCGGTGSVAQDIGYMFRREIRFPCVMCLGSGFETPPVPGPEITATGGRGGGKHQVSRRPIR